MKILFFFSMLIFASASFGATCTSISRSNYVTNQVLTSSALNTDFNTVYTAANALDGGCVTAGTLEYDSLNATQFAPLLKGVKEGCKVSYSSASQLSIGKCLAAVNGTFVSTTDVTLVSFGCTSCSSEVVSTAYYVYIATGSSGTTLTPLILTTAPNEDGYDDSGNKVIAKFYNNASSNIDTLSITNWKVNGFEYGKSEWETFTPTWAATGGTPTIGNGTLTAKRRRSGDSMEYQIYMITGSTSSIGGTSTWIFSDSSYSINTSKLATSANPQAVGSGYVQDSGTAFYNATAVYISPGVGLQTHNVGGRVGAANPFAWTAASADLLTIYATVPITGFN